MEAISPFLIWLVPILIAVIGWFGNFTITRTLKGIDQNQERIEKNQDRLAQILEKDIARLEERQDQLENNQKETDEKLNTLLGKHEAMMEIGGHKS